MPIRITFKLVGAAKLLQTLQQLERDFPGAVAAAVYLEAIGIMRRSEPLVPVDTSALVHSGWVGLPDPSSPKIIVPMGYSAYYALPVHERTDVFHPHGQANFLRQPYEAAVAGYATRVVARALQFVKAGVNAPSPDSRLPTEPPPVEYLLHHAKRHLAAAVRARVITKEQASAQYERLHGRLRAHGGARQAA